jgi:hypothetical protein
MDTSQKIAQIESQINSLRTQILGTSNAATARATETYERGVRERVFMHLASIPDAYYTLADMEKAVRYIVDGKVS